MWPSSSSNSAVIGGGGMRLNTFSKKNSTVDFSQQRKKLVDMIQEDFPRTPSPVHSNVTANETADSLSLHFESVPIVKRTNKKPFSISGSVDAVMAAAMEAEKDHSEININFEFEKMKILEEEEGIGWRNSVRIPPINNVTPEKQPIRSNLEPFAYAESFVPFVMSSVPQAKTLNSAPARSNNNYTSTGYTSNSNYQMSATYQDENVKATIMEDFRINRSKRYELFDLKGMMIDFSTDQHGSRFIQQKLETSSEAEKEAVFSEIYPLALQLMTDVFGNYVIQKFFEYGSREHRISLAHVMQGHVLSLSLQMYGCRVVQKALENVPSDEQILLVQELEGHVLRCVKDQNGNHVIQKCIECVPLRTSAPFLTASFLSQASTLAMHPYGCRVIQRIFEHGPPEHSDALLDELLKNTGTLIQDQYGNYVIQHVLEHGKPSERTRIIKFLQGRLLEYSRHKFASNVVEKCVSFGSDSERQELIEEVLKPIPAEDDNANNSSSSEVVVPLHLMMKDQFANYVVQKMLEVVDGGPQRDMILNCIKPHLAQLRKYTYGKHILAKVERMLGLAPSSEPITVVGVGDSQSREYHSAPNSPIPKQFYDHTPRRTGGGGNPKFSKNDLNEFPPLNGRRRM